MRLDVNIRRLKADDAQRYKALRLLGLKTAPFAFGGDYDEECERPDTSWREALAGDAVHIGAFVGDALVGMAYYVQFKGIKIKHRAFVYGVFVHPDQTGKSLGLQVLNALADHARQVGITQLHLGVGDKNEPAKRLYEKAGYQPYGHEPSAIRLPDGDVDEILMIKLLK
ncbi:MAG: GNAT family N-acetyltransferase [Pseudomonadota bacterium]